MKKQFAPLALIVVAGFVLLTAWGNAVAMFVCASLGLVAVALCEIAWVKDNAKAGKWLARLVPFIGGAVAVATVLATRLLN